MNERELLDLKNKVEKAKTELSALSGQKTYLMNELKQKWNCSSIEEARELLQKMEENLLDLEKIMKEKQNELQDKYGI